MLNFIQSYIDYKNRKKGIFRNSKTSKNRNENS